ncbi:mannitol dehydrogenase family protein [Sesbania bispinosa]|nr:mannitol dehydrogenase family protein [Sesbania bispinosa]
MEHDQEGRRVDGHGARPRGRKQRQPWAMAAVLLMMEARRSRARDLRATRRRQGYRGFSRSVKRLVVKRRSERRSGDGGDGRCSLVALRVAAGGGEMVTGSEEDGGWLGGYWVVWEALRVAAGRGEVVTGRTSSVEDGGWVGGYWWFGRLCAWLPAEVRW